MNKDIGQLCDGEIPPVVLDNKLGDYKAKLEKIANSKNYSTIGTLFLSIPVGFIAPGLVYEKPYFTLFGLVGSLVVIGITIGISTLEQESLKKTIDSLVQDYAKNLEDKQ